MQPGDLDSDRMLGVVEEEGFADSIAPFIAYPETFDSLFTWKAEEPPAGITWRLRNWYAATHPPLGIYEIETVDGYLGLQRCIIRFEIRHSDHGVQIAYLVALPAPELADDQDDTGSQ